jgi:hypothetical protein
VGYGPLGDFDERNVLRAMLGLPSEPVFLDIKPANQLSPGERRRLEERLSVVIDLIAGPGRDADEGEEPGQQWW